MVAQKLQKFQLSVEKHRCEQEEYLFLLCPGTWNFIGMYVFPAFCFKQNFSPKYNMKDSQEKSKRSGRQPTVIDGSLVCLDWINNGLVELECCLCKEAVHSIGDAQSYCEQLYSSLELLLGAVCVWPYGVHSSKSLTSIDMNFRQYLQLIQYAFIFYDTTKFS